MTAIDSKLTRIGVFYDGNFFFHVSNYYQYHHDRRARISVSGLHEFIRSQVADSEGCDVKYCQIVDAHYFRGRFRADEAAQRPGLLRRERLFDDVLVREGVVTHYLPLGPEGEKGIDVWLALEAFELAVLKRFDVSVLVACDGDFLPLVRKLNTVGTRVMLLGWDFQYVDQLGRDRETRTAQVLLNEVTYPVMMQSVIDDRSKRDNTVVKGLFVPPRETDAAIREVHTELPLASLVSDRRRGSIVALKEGYGFIRPEDGGENLFFFHADLANTDFNAVCCGDAVSYELGTNDKGVCAVAVCAEETAQTD